MTILFSSLNNFLKLLIYIFPTTFVLGNLAINLFLLFIIILGVIIYNKNLFHFEDKQSNYLLYSFFALVIFSTLIQFFLEPTSKDWIKSFLFLKYIFLIIILRTMIVKKEINLNYVIKFCLILSSLIAMDILLQFAIGKNLLNFEPIKLGGGFVYYTGIFKDELIAGGFLLMFSIPGIFALPIIFKSLKKTHLSLLFFITSIFFLAAMTLAGNRMPVILFLLFLTFLAFFLKKNNLKLFILFFTSSFLILILALVLNFSKLEKITGEKTQFEKFSVIQLFKRYKNFYTGIPNPIVILREIKKEYPSLEKYKNTGKQFHTIKEFNSTKNYQYYPFTTGHLPIYITSIDLFIDKPFIGRGIKSYRNFCKEKIHKPNRVCESHPHNYYLEILNDTGLIGLVLILSLIYLQLKGNYTSYRFGEKRNDNLSNWVYLSVLLSIIIQFFPLKSTGSFFSTFNASYTFYFLGISFGLNEMRLKKLLN